MKIVFLIKKIKKNKKIYVSLKKILNFNMKIYFFHIKNVYITKIERFL